MAGSKGAISYTTLFPMVKRMRMAYKDGDMGTAREIQRRLLEYDALINNFGGKCSTQSTFNI